MITAPARFRFPQTSADLFHLLSLDTLANLIELIDFASATLHDISHLVHRRPPESLEALADAANTTLPNHLRATILSDEFQLRIISHLLTAFPTPPRAYLLGGETPAPPGHLTLHPTLADPATTSKTLLLQAIAEIIRLIPHITGFFLPSIDPLPLLLQSLPPRPSDRITIRLDDPITLLLARANQAVATIIDDPQGTPARTLLNHLDLPELPPGPSLATLQSLALRALQNRVICPPNPICTLLSKPGQADYQSAIEATAIHDLELIDAPTKPATPFLTRETALAHHAAALLEATAQDRLFREVALWGLQKNQTSTIRGTDLIRLAGRRLRDALPRQLVRQRAPPLPNPVVAAGPQATLDYLAANPPPAESMLRLRFGAGGNGNQTLAHGWSGAEPGYVWTNAHHATLKLPRPTAPHEYRLRILAAPYVAADRRPYQDLDIIIAQRPVATARLTERAVLDLPLPWAAIADHDPLTIEFDLPFATRPVDIDDGTDTRHLAICLYEIMLYQDAPPSDRDLMLNFESLGENCEFGLVQRRCGADPLGLLRFASAPFPRLLAALRDQFNGFGRPDRVHVHISDNGTEYMVLDQAYGLRFHAWVLTSEKSADEVHRRECRRLPFLARKLLEDLAEGRKIFVYHGMTPLTASQAAELAALIASHGPAPLLWVEPADETHPPGTVEPAGHQLLKGYIDRFAPADNAHDLSLTGWTTLCRNALHLWTTPATLNH